MADQCDVCGGDAKSYGPRRIQSPCRHLACFQGEREVVALAAKADSWIPAWYVPPELERQREDDAPDDPEGGAERQPGPPRPPR